MHLLNYNMNWLTLRHPFFFFICKIKCKIKVKSISRRKQLFSTSMRNGTVQFPDNGEVEDSVCSPSGLSPHCWHCDFLTISNGESERFLPLY